MPGVHKLLRDSMQGCVRQPSSGSLLPAEITRGVHMRIPLVYGDYLLLLHTGGKNPSSIRVGSDAWYVWLANEQNKSLSFRNDLGTFIARRERLRNGAYWYAYRRNKGSFRKAYLGRTEKLTLERLNAVAAALNRQDYFGDALNTNELEEGAPQIHAISIGAGEILLPTENLSVRYPAQPEQASGSPRASFCNLPVQPTALIGREQEVKAVHGFLQRSEVRILTF